MEARRNLACPRRDLDSLISGRGGGQGAEKGLELLNPACEVLSLADGSGPGAEAGWAAYADNDMAEARRRFEAAVAQCDNDQYARTGLGYVNLRDGNVQEAERLWTVVGTAEPNNVDALVGLGLARWRSGDIDAVHDYFSTVLELQPGHPTAAEYLERISGACGCRSPFDMTSRPPIGCSPTT